MKKNENFYEEPWTGPCAECDGTGSIECDLCEGKGEYKSKVCPACNGEEYIECPDCGGSGKATYQMGQKV
jgi:DnaJ-class molecular chaperone